MGKIKQIFWISLGVISIGLGFVGAFLPVLPTTPFLLLASFAFTKGSKKIEKWFLSTKIYKKYLEDFDKNRQMTLNTKLSILLPASIMICIAFLVVNNIYIKILLVCLLILKYLYFIFKIKTIK